MTCGMAAPLTSTAADAMMPLSCVLCDVVRQRLPEQSFLATGIEWGMYVYTGARDMSIDMGGTAGDMTSTICTCCTGSDAFIATAICMGQRAERKDARM